METSRQSMFGKLARRNTLRTAAFLFLSLVLVQFFFDINVFNGKATFLTDIDLLRDALQRAKSAEIDMDNKYQFTAIVLHWKRLLQVQEAVRSYVNSNLFKEIIVWNNNPEITLAHNQILPINNSSTLIYIVNSKKNFKDQAKYRACAGARTLVCYYADDDWNSLHYAKSLIASFRSDPNLLHSTTNDVTYYNNLLWAFMDPKIDLHAGFSWIGCGSVFLREHAQQHLQLLTRHLGSQHGMHILDKNDQKSFVVYLELIALSDVFFSVWLNDIPSQMVVNLRAFRPDPNITDAIFSSTKNFLDLQDTSAILAIRKLEYTLRLNESTTNVTFSRKQNRRFPYCVRSPSLNDDYIFFSNILPVDFVSVPFDIARDADRATYRNVPGGPNYTHFVTHSTLKAVDNDEKTCWSPLDTVQKGHFFAIDFLRIQSNITFALVIEHSWKLQKSLDIRVSFDGVLWISHQSLKSTSTNNDKSSAKILRRVVVESKTFSPKLQSFRYLVFNATNPYAESFRVCDIRIINSTQT